MTRQRGNEIDEFVTGALRNNLARPAARPRHASTWPAAATPASRRSTRRGATFFAETGNSALRPYDSWADFGLGIRHPESLVNFIAAYGTHATITARRRVAAKRAAADAASCNGGDGAPAGRRRRSSTAPARGRAPRPGLDDVDFWVGGLAEKQMPFGGLLGSTFNFVFETQMEKLQDGDRFYYLRRTPG